MINRYPTKQIFVGNVPIGGDAPIPVQSMTFTKTSDVKATVEQITALHFAGADIVRVAVPNMEAALALKEIKSQVSLPLVADIHFHYKLALIAAEVVDCIRINPGNIGDRKRVQEVVKACTERNIPIRIGVNSGSLEKQFEDKYGQTPEGMVASADYNIKYLEDLGFTNLKISLKASDVQRTVAAYRKLRPMNNYPFHLGVTEAGTQFHSTIKSSIALGSLLLDGIGDTLRVSMTGELEEEIKVGKAILKDVGIAKDGLNIVSCPTCGRIEADLVSAVAEIERRTKHIKAPLDVSVMGCVVNAIGEAKSADVAIAFGKGSGLVMKKGEIIAKLSGDALINRFIEEVELEAQKESLMDVDLSKFKSFLEEEIEYLQEEFLTKYIINIRRVEEDELEKINDFFTLIIKHICLGDLEKAYKVCRDLIDFNIELSIPYIMLTNELMNLQKLIIEKLIIKNAKDEIYELYKLHLAFENVIAQVYLDRYTKKLQSKNNLRISSLSDIYEKNIINHYQAHLEWLNDLAKAVEFRNSKFFPQTNHTLCTFGKWLQDSGKTIIQNNSKFKSISKQHENLHLMAKQIKNYIAKKEENNHILLTCLEKCEMLSLSLGTELALIDNTLINSKASKDPLTGALNRQRLNQLYMNQLEISFATSEPFVLVMCDFDYFKNINDTYGHLAGDKMLKSFVNLVKKSLRNSDMIIRYGGEEFVFILPAIKTEKARALLNKIRVDFSEFFIIHEENKISTTLSMGMLEIDPDNEESYLTDFENAISIVDKKLYEAKNSGRNKVC